MPACMARTSAAVAAAAAAAAVWAMMQATTETVAAETPTVNRLRLKLANPSSFSFTSGQWVDFHVPGLQAVGGYSICSTPAQLLQTGTLDLCVKHSSHPCAQWVHTEAAPGEQVSVAVGGTFTLLQDSCSKPSLFVAGGIGITALASMLASLVEQQQEQQQKPGADTSPLPPFVLYSAAQPCEFALLKQLLQWQQTGAINMQLHTTRTHGLPAALQEAIDHQQQQQQLPAAAVVQGFSLPQVLQGRIGESHLRAALQRLTKGSSRSTAGEFGWQDVAAYVCGPSMMSDDVVRALLGLGLPQGSVRTERWW